MEPHAAWAHPSSLAPMVDSDPSHRAAAPDGKWAIGGGSVAGFRSQVSLLGHVTSIVGHSTALTGSIHVVGGGVEAGSFRIDLASLQIFGKSNAGLNRMIDTTRYPAATFVLHKPIALATSPLMNVTYHAPATGSLTMHGITRPVTFTFIARYTGSALEAAGSIAVRFSDWNLRAPFGIQNTGAIEFTLRMSRASSRRPSGQRRPDADPYRALETAEAYSGGDENWLEYRCSRTRGARARLGGRPPRSRRHVGTNASR
jgi:polyisoprenoid-binding protein YceI